MMKKYALLLGFGVALAGAGVVSRAADDEAEAAAAVKKVADMVGKKDWAALVKEGAPIGKKHDLLDVMSVFKKREGDKGGLGVGPKAGVIMPDGIQAKIDSMVEGVTTKDLAHAKDLARMADIAAAVASIAAKAPNDEAKKTPKDTEQWEKFAKEMHDASREFARAVQGKDTNKVKAAATKLQGSCTKCHEKYRD